VLDPARFADGIAGNETVRWIAAPATCEGLAPGPCQPVADFPPDPSGIYAFSAGTAWLTTYPDETVRTVDLAGGTLNPTDAALPPVTGPLYAAGGGVFAAMGGFGHARLGELDPASGVLAASYDLQAGNGPLTCAETTLP
jgi:hypothetical protein